MAENLEKIRCDKPTSDPNIVVHITGAPNNGIIKVSGYPVVKGVPFQDMKITRIAHSNNEANIIFAEIVTSLEYKLNVKRDRKEYKKRCNQPLAGPYSDAFFDINNPLNFVDLWAESTSLQRLKWFELNILPYVDSLENEDDLNLDDLFEIIIKKTGSNKKTIRKNIYKVAADHLRDAQIIHDRMRRNKRYLPDFKFSLDVKYEGQINEKIKSLPFAIVLKFRKAIEDLIEEDPLMARTVAIMEAGGARTAEAAAPNKISDYGEFILVSIRNQIKNKKKNPGLKTVDSYRTVLLDDWGAYIIRKSEEKMIALGVDLGSYIDPDKVSAFIKKLLIECGLDETAVQLWRQEMMKDICGEENDVSAYILRRNRANVWAHFCGYTKEEIDYQLGHSPKFDWKPSVDWGDIATYTRLAKKLVRYDLSSEVSNSFRYKPIQITCEQKMQIDNNPEVGMVNCSAERVLVRINVSTSEPGKNIFAKTTGVIIKKESSNSFNEERIRRNPELIVPIKNMKYE